MSKARRLLATTLFASAATMAVCLCFGGASAANRYRVLVSFNGQNGLYPSGAPAVDSAGNVYGVTFAGGSHGNVYELTADGTLQTLHAFQGGNDGGGPEGGVLYDESTGEIFGTTCDGGTGNGGVLYSLAADGTYTILHNFDQTTEGSCPEDAPSRDEAGNFYGTASGGGANNKGMVWKLGFDGTLSVLHDFNGTDGAEPEASITIGKRGYLFGTAYAGGKNGGGTVFEITPRGKFHTLHNFDVNVDGASVYAGVIQDKSGNLYGTTQIGGPQGDGTVYRIAPGGKLKLLASFDHDTAGGDIKGGLVLLKGKLYGTTDSSGDPNCGCGTVFELGLDGSFSVLHAFTGPPNDAEKPDAGLAAGPHGFLYGNTEGGGESGDGTVFRVKR